MPTGANHRLKVLFVFAAVAIATSGCVATGPSPEPTSAPPVGSATAPTPEPTVQDAAGDLVIQSRLTLGEKIGLEKVVEAFNAKGGGQVKINSVPNETYREQLPSYLTSANPPDVYTYLGGEATRAFADEGLLLDISDIWKEFNFSDALRGLSQTSKGVEVFVPTSYYWLGIYYDTRVFANAAVKPPTTWEEFIAACEALQAAGVVPIGIGTSDAAWLTAAWFDYLNLRVNGRDFHLDLLAGKESFEDPRVAGVFAKWDDIKGYFDPNSAGLSFAQATTDLVQGRTAMFLAGSWLQYSIPEDQLKYFDYFQFPIIDPAVPVAEEAPTDGFFASANTDKPKLTKEFLSYIASAEAQQIMFDASGSGTLLPANPDAKVALSPYALKGQAILEGAAGLTQFYNRDSGDALLPPAEQALTQYLASVKDVPAILAEWQAASAALR